MTDEERTRIECKMKKDMEDTYYKNIPESTLRSMKRYVEEGSSVGGFLTKVFCNDLLGAIMKADEKNLNSLKEILFWMNWESPDECWGSEEKVERWIKKFEVKAKEGGLK